MILFWVMGAAAFLYGCVVLVRAPPPLKWVTLLCWALPGVFIVAFLFTNRWYAGHRARFMREVRPAASSPLAREVAAIWRRPNPLQVLKRIPDCVRRAALAGDRAVVVCLGAVRVPEVGDRRFEPEIVTATELWWRQLPLVPLAAVILVVWFLNAAGYVSLPNWLNLGTVGYVLFVGIGVAAAWAWRAFIRPTYLRLAPGMVQVLEYGLWGSKPTVRSYPMQAGTLVVVHDALGKLHLTLMRADRKHGFALWRMRRADERLERIWAALLSTAPIPPLSEDALIA